MSMLLFLLVLGVLIAVHEWGHFIVARRCGVQVDEFAIGFGPKLLKWKKGATEYSICAIPLGGYVKMAGDERDGCTGDPKEFYSQPVGKRALIVLAGPVVNYILAFLCFVLVFMLGYVDMNKSAENVAPSIGQLLEEAPAAKAGLQVGDTVKTINGEPMDHWADLQDTITESTSDVLTMTIEREGQIIAVEVTPEKTVTKDIFGREHNTRRIGIGPVQLESMDHVAIERYGFFGAVKRGAEELWSITYRTYEALYQIVIGARSAKEGMTGLVGIFFVIKFAASVGIAFLLHIVGVISASLAIFNLLPIIPLDGGHLFLYTIEKLRGRPLSEKTDELVTKVGFGLIMVLALYVFYVDFERIGLIDKIVNLWPK